MDNKIIVQASDKENLRKLLGNDISHRNLEDKLNIILNNSITNLTDSITTNSLYIESYGTMYFNYIILRKQIFKKTSFVRKLLSILAKIVHPNIQIFYGIMFNKNEPFIIFEYITSLNLDELSYLKHILTLREEIFLKLLIINRIVETLGFLYNSSTPYLMLNPRNVKLNYRLLSDKHQHLKIIYCNNDYIEANIIKITEIGSWIKYDKNLCEIYNIKNEEFEDIAFMSPDLVKYLTDNDSSDFLQIDSLENCDLWSFGALTYEIFTDLFPYSDIENKAELIKEIKKANFISKHYNSYITIIRNEYKDFEEDLINVWKIICKCTTQKIKFADLINLVKNVKDNFWKKWFKEDEIKEIREKVEQMDFRIYQLEKLEEINELNQEINFSKELSEKMKNIQSKIKAMKEA